MASDHYAALDSNCLTFFVQATWDYDPDNDATELRWERTALLQAYLFTAEPYSILPVVNEEYERIANEEKLARHFEVTSILTLDVLGSVPQQEYDKRLNELRALHSGENDCRALAQAELYGIPVLLTFDKRMLNNLACVANGTRLMAPSRYLSSLGLSAESEPKLQPHPKNPLCKRSWWKELRLKCESN